VERSTIVREDTAAEEPPNAEPEKPTSIALILFLGLVAFGVLAGGFVLLDEAMNSGDRGQIDPAVDAPFDEPFDEPEAVFVEPPPEDFAPPVEAVPDLPPIPEIDFDALGEPVLDERLLDSGEQRVREIVIQMGPDAQTIDVLAMNRAGRLERGSNGVAVRTTDDARILLHGEIRQVPRPEECEVGAECTVKIWLTMGRQFFDLYPKTDIIVWAGTDAQATMEALNAGPPEMA